MSKKPYYITTPIYYPSAKLHIGHAYCTVATDVLARYKRLQGYEVMFLTGTDEHGQKIEKKAQEAGMTPQEFVDSIVEAPGGVKDLWKLMNISNTRFIRTTDDYHVKSIQKIFRKMYDNGDIYKGAYKGKYCTDCEAFWTETQLKDGKCPDCGREVHDAEEEAYFFRLSKYADRIRELLTTTDFLEPKSRVNEMVKNFIDPGLEDLCVSRTSFSWGVPVDFDPKHVTYVWLDALFNYVTALGYQTTSMTTLTPSGRGSTLWARRSFDSTPSSGPPFVCRWVFPSPKRCSVTAGSCWTGARCPSPRATWWTPTCSPSGTAWMLCASLSCGPSPSGPTETLPTSCSFRPSTPTLPTTWATWSAALPPWRRSILAGSCPKPGRRTLNWTTA